MTFTRAIRPSFSVRIRNVGASQWYCRQIVRNDRILSILQNPTSSTALPQKYWWPAVSIPLSHPIAHVASQLLHHSHTLRHHVIEDGYYGSIVFVNQQELHASRIGRTLKGKRAAPVASERRGVRAVLSTSPIVLLSVKREPPSDQGAR